MGKMIRETSSSKFNKIMNFSITNSLITFIVGLFIVLFSKQINVILGYLVAFIFLFYGITTIYKYMKRDGAKLYSFNMIIGIIMIALGIVTIFVPKSVTNFAMIAVGLYLIMVGASKISYGSWLKVGNDSSWFITFVIGILLVVFGILVILNPFESGIGLTKILGIFIILSSILDFSNTILLKRKQEDIVKIFW